MTDGLGGILDALQKMFESLGLGSAGIWILFIILFAALNLPWIRIFRKAGFSPGNGLLMCIPFINIFVFLVFAFHEWPIEREAGAPSESAFWR